MKKRVVAVIQARTGSRRLPKKVLCDILGRPMLRHQIERLKRCTTLDSIVIATSESADDAVLLDLAREAGVHSFAGSETDVLDRIHGAAREQGADVVVRVTGDCPLLPAQVVDTCVTAFLESQPPVDYLGVAESFAEGLDVEVFSFEALEAAHRDATRAYEREHVTPHLWQSGRFATRRLHHEPDISVHRWSVDEPADLRMVTAIYEELFPRFGYDFNVPEILTFLSDRPELMAINQSTVRNAGFLDSLRQERRPFASGSKLDITESNKLWERAKDLIPSGTQTLSKGPTQFVDGVAPKYFVRGSGSHVWDADGNEFIDYPMALGAIILGHAYPAVNEAIKTQMDKGWLFSMMHPLEVEVGELIRSLVPCAEMVRFGKNGSDATTGAVRLARACTGREIIAHCGYHGWHDWYIASTTRNKGVPRSALAQQFAFTYNDLSSLEKLFSEQKDQIAAVMMEPYGVTLPEPGFLEGVRKLCTQNGAVLVFDEVASGFRFHLGGVHQRFGVNPDLVCFGKAMGNGMPISVLAGRADVMRTLDEVFYSFTFGGDCLSLAATKATIHEMQTKGVIDHLWQMGERLKAGFNRLASDYGVNAVVRCDGLAPRPYVIFSAVGDADQLVVKSLFQQEAFKRGIVFTGAHCLCFSHSVDDIEATLGSYQGAFEVFAAAVADGDFPGRLEGKPVQAVFRAVN